ncbi:MAG: hypothetical protein UX51_C0006G0020 [Candidatus Azambacteria bacterium GW2011_GWF2_46_32]|uniref:Uncharacterized protein n=1 Tax=Candidatus Azambacteria bacterium GW2011_GWF2_46_32 TaxID=1618628 RepID=A0A0G1SY93_9BACT|nr:MAG: hypothetical protein UX51_C0006G0020 [Candidatus Azambacteria bacterium GW2011_GWF2_46_32]
MPWFIADDNFKEHWNRFVIEHDGSFLQSREKRGEKFGHCGIKMVTKYKPLL